MNWVHMLIVLVESRDITQRQPGCPAVHQATARGVPAQVRESLVVYTSWDAFLPRFGMSICGKVRSGEQSTCGSWHSVRTSSNFSLHSAPVLAGTRITRKLSASSLLQD